MAMSERRAPARWGRAVDVGLCARADRGPVRLRRNGRQPKAVGLYFSVKSGRHLPYESTLELHDLWRAEVDSSVVRSLPQPFTLHLVRAGVLTRYTPDRMDEMADGSRLVVEVKDRLAPTGEQTRYDDVAALLAARGLVFELRQRSQIQAQPTLDGVEAVQRHRRTQLDAAAAAYLRRRLQSGPAPLGELAAGAHGGPAGWALVCAAAVRRLVRIDLANGLQPDAAVELVA